VLERAETGAEVVDCDQRTELLERVQLACCVGEVGHRDVLRDLDAERAGGNRCEDRPQVVEQVVVVEAAGAEVDEDLEVVALLEQPLREVDHAAVDRRHQPEPLGVAEERGRCDVAAVDALQPAERLVERDPPAR